MGLIDTVTGTVIGGYAVFKLTNAVLERVFFTAAGKTTSRTLVSQLASRDISKE